jgi:hypothetical protein
LKSQILEELGTRFYPPMKKFEAGYNARFTTFPPFAKLCVANSTSLIYESIRMVYLYYHYQFFQF